MLPLTNCAASCGSLHQNALLMDQSLWGPTLRSAGSKAQAGVQLSECAYACVVEGRIIFLKILNERILISGNPSGANLTGSSLL